MLKLKEAIVVEGRYDKNTLSQVVDTLIFQTDGFAIRNHPEMMALLRKVAERRGLIVFTDSDGAGFQIRSFLKSAIPPQYLKHAYIPDVYGKESRKQHPGKEGKLGVEGMKPELLADCLLRAGATPEDGNCSEKRDPITKQDLYLLELTGRPDSADRRLQLKRVLGLPEHLSTNALLDALNAMFDREEFLGGE